MCKGYATHSGMVKTEFIAASSRARRSVDIDVATRESVPTPEPTTADPEPTTANPEPTTADPEPTTDYPEPTTADPEPTTADAEPTTSDSEPMSSRPKPRTVPTTTEEITTPPEPTTLPWWARTFERVTRPPLPASFSSGSFDISFKVRQEMSPSCRMLVYYVRGRETVADSTIVDVADTFANKVGSVLTIC